jgi:hypothetical protein
VNDVDKGIDLGSRWLRPIVSHLYSNTMVAYRLIITMYVLCHPYSMNTREISGFFNEIHDDQKHVHPWIPNGNFLPYIRTRAK